jgi:radical SAM protein with 4Fe4S-binding SPASM domain
VHVQIFPEHFDRGIDAQAARQLFKQSVKLVEVETFTFCNRVCWFCSNAHIDRRSTNKYMDEALYLRILSDLASIGYDQTLTYCRYNEPLADRIILQRIRQARTALPQVRLMTHTNGDYLDREYLDELRDAGLNELKVQVYLGNDDRFSDERITKRMANRLKALGLPYKMTMENPGYWYAAKVEYEGMKVSFESYNFDVLGTDRGQLVQLAVPYHRRSPCWVVFQDMYIDYDGSVVPCCNIRSDEPTHKDYVVDSLKDGRSIFQAYANSALADWRRDLLTFGEKKKPCDTCRFKAFEETPEFRQYLDRNAAALLGQAK